MVHPLVFAGGLKCVATEWSEELGVIVTLWVFCWCANHLAVPAGLHLGPDSVRLGSTCGTEVDTCVLSASDVQCVCAEEPCWAEVLQQQACALPIVQPLMYSV